MDKKLKIVGFFSRRHGIAVLNELIKNKNFQVLRVYTHSLKPKSEDVTRSIRTDYPEYQKICYDNKIELVPIDSLSYQITDFPNCDYIVEVSWRFFIPKEIIEKASKISFGVHRGKLPDYAGAEPIKQALEKNEKFIFLSAHNLDAKIDEGDVFNEIRHSVDYDVSKTLDENIQRLRDEITPLFPKIVIDTIKKFEK